MSGSNHGNADVYDSDESEEKHEKTETLPRIPQHVRLTKRQSDEEKREKTRQSEEEKREKTETLPRIPQDDTVKKRLLQLLKELEHMIEWDVPDSLIHKKK